MRQVAKRGILTAVATGSVLASTAGYAYASAEAQGGAANSPGVGSGNAVQAPVDVPVNACGNTVSVVGLLNPAMGNHCGNTEPSGAGHGGSGDGGSGDAGSGSSAEGGTHGSPGVASGNNVQAPVSVPVNACGNSVNVVGLGNPAFGNDCGNHGSGTATPPSSPPPGHGDDCPPGGTDHNPPPRSTPPSSTPPGNTPPSTGGTNQTPPAGTGTTRVSIPEQPTQSTATSAAREQLASTGADGLELIAPAGVALLLAGGVLYRRSRVGAR